MAANNLLLSLDRPQVSVDEFAEAAQALVALVGKVAQEMKSRPQAIRWIITDLRVGSALLEAVPDTSDELIAAGDIERIISAAGQGLHALESRPERPPYYSDAALAQARRLAELLNRGEPGNGFVRLGSVTVAPSKRLAANVDELTLGRLKSIGTLEGTLVTVSMRDGLRCYVDDRRWGRRIECHLHEDLLPSVLNAFGKCVLVRGVAWSRQDGTPQRFEVRTFELLPDAVELPRARTVRGILRGYVVDADDE